MCNTLDDSTVHTKKSFLYLEVFVLESVSEEQTTC